MLMRFIPDFKGFDFFPHNLRLPFMRYKGLRSGLSLVAMAISLALCMTRGLNYGVDFKGGSLIEVQSKSGPADVASAARQAQRARRRRRADPEFGSASDVLIRVEQQPGGESAQQAALKKVVDALGADFTQRRVEVVGPAVSSELRMTGIIAVLPAFWRSSPTSGSASNGSSRSARSWR